MAREDGQQILKGLAETREFFKQISLMLRTAEELFSERGWEDATGGKKCSNITSHLYHPESWMPQDICRLYLSTAENEENKDLILCVGVLLDREKAWGGFKEPWITCGLYQFAPGRKPERPQGGEAWWVTTHLDDKHDPDGTFYRCTYSSEEQEQWGIVYQATMALPLVQITSADDLRQKVVDPLLEEISKVER